MKRTLLGVAVAAGSSAALVVGAGSVSAAPADLVTQATCVLGVPGATVSFTQDGTVELVRQFSLGDIAVTRDRGPVRVYTEAPTGKRKFNLIGSGDQVLANSTVQVVTCDGWNGRGGFIGANANVSGSPMSIGAIPEEPSVRTGDGTRVYRGESGALYAVRQDQATHVVRGAIYDYYLKSGEWKGLLGWPRTSESGVADLDGYYTAFDGGTVYWTPEAGAHAVRGPIADGFAARGYERSVLDLPVSEEFGPLRGGGYGQHFRGGSLYWSPSTGAHVVTGGVAALYTSTGWENGALGYPTSDAAPVGKGAEIQFFQGGAVYSSSDTGTHLVKGAIFGAYGASGYEFGALGLPTTSELSTPDGIGRFNHFQGGSVYWSPSTGAQVVVDSKARQYWERKGWEAGFLGYPTSALNPIRDKGTFERFQGGVVYTSGEGTFAVRGALLNHWGSLGWENSDLGYPSSDEFSVPGGLKQNFENGSLTYSWASGQVTRS